MGFLHLREALFTNLSIIGNDFSFSDDIIELQLRIRGEREEFITEDDCYFCLTERIMGHQLHAEDFYSKGHSTAFRLGVMLAKLHQSLRQIETAADRSDLISAVSEALPKLQGVVNIPQEIISGYERFFRNICPDLPVQLIHRDPNPGNIIRDGDTWSFLDFELSEENVRIFDPCYAATAILSESIECHDIREWLDVYRGILRGYDSYSELTAEEKAALPHMILANQVISAAWFAGQEKYAEIFEIKKNDRSSYRKLRST